MMCGSNQTELPEIPMISGSRNHLDASCPKAEPDHNRLSVVSCLYALVKSVRVWAMVFNHNEESLVNSI